jgi:hypothetical protein
LKQLNIFFPPKKTWRNIFSFSMALFVASQGYIEEDAKNMKQKISRREKN